MFSINLGLLLNNMEYEVFNIGNLKKYFKSKLKYPLLAATASNWQPTNTNVAFYTICMHAVYPIYVIAYCSVCV